MKIDTELRKLLEKVADNTISDDKCDKLMSLLRLDSSYYLALREVVRQGRWRHARTSLLGYVRKAVQGEAIKKKHGEFLAEGAFEYKGPASIADLGIPHRLRELMDTKEDQRASDRKSAAAEHDIQTHYDDDAAGDLGGCGEIPLDRVHESLIARVSNWNAPNTPELTDEEVIKLFQQDLQIDLAKLGQFAGLSLDETILLGERLASGVSRDEIMSRAESDEERREEQALWRSLDRKRGRVREVLLTGKPYTAKPRGRPKKKSASTISKFVPPSDVLIQKANERIEARRREILRAPSIMVNRPF